MIEYDGEIYVTVTEVARQFKISRSTCYSNLLQYVQKCYLPGRKYALYKQSDVERFSHVHVVVRLCSMSPASTTTAETGNGVTSSSHSQQNEVDWQSQYSLPDLQMQHVPAQEA